MNALDVIQIRLRELKMTPKLTSISIKSTKLGKQLIG